jgi:ABC-type sugar transport system substrate-binding protein
VEPSPVHRRRSLSIRALVALVVLVALAVTVSACGGGGSSSSGSTSESTEGGTTTSGGEPTSTANPPSSVETSWGTFTLDPKIAEKVEKGEPVNYLFSFGESGTAGFGEQFEAGYEYGCEKGNEIYPLNCEIVAPVQYNPPLQISQVQAKLAAGQVDCLAIQPPTETAVNKLINEVSAKGIPVFAVGEENFANSLMNFTQHHEKEGEVAAESVLKYMEENNKHFKVFAVSSGLPTVAFAQKRMAGFEKVIKQAIPDAEWLTTKSKPLEVPLEPAEGFDVAKSFISSNPSLEVFYNTDIGGEPINHAIAESGKQGEIYSVAFNPTQGQLKEIEEGLQIAVIDQRWFDQAAYGGQACATFLKTGKILPNTQKPEPIVASGVEEERAALEEIENGEG